MPVKMYGPSFDGSGTLVNRDVPDGDVAAYAAAGYKPGSVDAGVVPDEPDPEPMTETVDLSKMTKAKLLEEAEGAGVEVSSSMTKAEIIDAIEG